MPSIECLALDLCIHLPFRESCENHSQKSSLIGNFDVDHGQDLFLLKEHPLIADSEVNLIYVSLSVSSPDANYSANALWQIEGDGIGCFGLLHKYVSKLFCVLTRLLLIRYSAANFFTLKFALRLAFRSPQYFPKVLILRIKNLVIDLRFGLTIIGLPGSIWLLIKLKDFLLRSSMLYGLVKLFSFLLIGDSDLICFGFDILIGQVVLAYLVE